MNDENIHIIFKHAMAYDGYISKDYFIMRDGQYVLDDIREMFRGFKLGWNAALYLAEVEIGIQGADAGKLTSIEDVKASWKKRQP